MTNLFYRPIKQITKTMPTKKDGFTLIEILVSLVVFGLVMATASSVFYKFYQDYQRQKKYLECVENARWALEFMTREVRDAETMKIKKQGTDTLKCKDDDPGPGHTKRWLQRVLRVAPSGNGDMMRLRYQDVGPGGSGQEYFEFCNFLIDNPSLNNFFEPDVWPQPQVLSLELTLRPNPDPAVSSSNNNRSFTVRTKVRLRK